MEVTGEASADLLPDVNAKAASKTTAMPRVLYMDMPPVGDQGEGAILPDACEVKGTIPSNSLDSNPHPCDHILYALVL